ncbi:MAG: helix-turn-helix domain-containing protein [Fimbriimonadaceae bacterium]
MAVFTLNQRELPSVSGFGPMRNLKEFEGLRLYEASLPDEPEIPKHSHAYFTTRLVLDGVFTESDSQGEELCDVGSTTIRPAYTEHWNRRVTEKARIFVADISEDRLAVLREYSPPQTAAFTFTGGPVVGLFRRLYAEYCDADNLSPLAIEGILLEIFAGIARHSHRLEEKSVPKWLRQAKEMLRERFDECLSLDQVAKEVSVHPVHLARTFRQKFGCTLGEYVRQLRVDYACHQIVLTDKPMGAIASESGFGDQSQFCHTFKKHTGMTPAEYRRVWRVR